MAVPDLVAEASLDWALAHVRRFGDTDIFPLLFEFDLFTQADWPTIRKDLATRPLVDHRAEAHRQVLAVKPDAGFRVVTQLNPFDALIYTALVYEAATFVEKHRVPARKRVACSYRVALDANGSFFGRATGWESFHKRSEALADHGRHPYVLVADIADFYNQTYHHRVANALENAGVSTARSKNIENFLGQLTAKQSRGLPIGPHASIVLAEATLDDVDKFLLNAGRAHVRYVDDFRIFCRSERDAMRALHDLTKYLYTAHRLALQFSKTRILPLKDFRRQELFDPEEEEERSKTARLDRLFAKASRRARYEEPDEPDESEIDREVRRNLQSLFRRVVKSQILHLGATRHLLRRATELRSGVLHPIIFENLERLAPALRDVAVHLRATLRPARARSFGPRLVRFLKDSPSGQLPFVRMWALYVLEQVPGLASSSVAIQLATDSIEGLDKRPAALIARAHKHVDWIRSQKEIWQAYGPWERRAIIWAAAVLPSDERRSWLRPIASSGDALEAAIARRALNGP